MQDRRQNGSWDMKGFVGIAWIVAAPRPHNEGPMSIPGLTWDTVRS